MRHQMDVLREEVERLLRANVALILDRDAALSELRLCREALRRARLTLWGIRPLDQQKPA